MRETIRLYGITFGGIAALSFCLAYFGAKLSAGISYLLAINLAALLIFGADKFFAKANFVRVPERMLIAFAIIGGSPAVAVGINFFRHKTRKVRFLVSICLILAVQMLALKLLR